MWGCTISTFIQFSLEGFGEETIETQETEFEEDRQEEDEFHFNPQDSAIPGVQNTVELNLEELEIDNIDGNEFTEEPPEDYLEQPDQNKNILNHPSSVLLL